jgi:monoamine oxidase
MTIGLTRREFLRVGSTAMAAFASFPVQASEPPQTKLVRRGAAKKIIVAGAGLAGLSAAYELTVAGHNVIVLEAQLRTGGRVLTLRAPFSDGLYAEAGASRIPDHHEWTLKYARLFGLRLTPFYPNTRNEVQYVGGKGLRVAPGEAIDLRQVPLNLTPEERRLGAPQFLSHYLKSALAEIGDFRESNWPPQSLRKYDRISFAEFLRQQGASPGAVTLFDLGFGLSEELSALFFLRYLADHLRTRKMYKIDGGNDRLPKAFAGRLKEKIQYGARIMRLEQDERTVRVTFKQGGTYHTISGDYLISAIPFSALRTVEVTPRFSPGKQRAIEQLSYLSSTRVLLQARSRFWTHNGLSGFAQTDHHTEIWHPTFDQPGPRGILLSYMKGSLSRRVVELKESDRIELAVKQMEEVFPGVRKHVEGGLSHSWDEDEFSRGAVSALQPGQMMDLLPHITDREGRIYFAGEHTSPSPSWMQSALASGNRAAQEVNDAAPD